MTTANTTGALTALATESNETPCIEATTATHRGTSRRIRSGCLLAISLAILSATTGCWMSVAAPPPATPVGAAAPTTPAAPAASEGAPVEPAPDQRSSLVPDNAAATAMPSGISATQPRPAPAAAEPAEVRRARFSIKRYVLEALVGEAAGLVTSLALCNGSSCPGDGWVAFAGDLAVAPLATWGTGRLMGGRGTLVASYLGAGPAIVPLATPVDPTASPDQTLSQIQTEVAISAILLPLTSALMVEVSSHLHAVAWENQHRATLAVQPIYGPGRLGAAGTLSLQF